MTNILTDTIATLSRHPRPGTQTGRPGWTHPTRATRTTWRATLVTGTHHVDNSHEAWTNPAGLNSLLDDLDSECSQRVRVPAPKQSPVLYFV